MQVVNALEIFFYLSVVEANHLYQFLACLLVLSAFEEDLELPGSLIKPELKRSFAFRVKISLSLLEVFFGEQ